LITPTLKALDLLTLKTLRSFPWITIGVRAQRRSDQTRIGSEFVDFAHQYSIVKDLKSCHELQVRAGKGLRSQTAPKWR